MERILSEIKEFYNKRNYYSYLKKMKGTYVAIILCAIPMVILITSGYVFLGVVGAIICIGSGVYVNNKICCPKCGGKFDARLPIDSLKFCNNCGYNLLEHNRRKDD